MTAVSRTVPAADLGRFEPIGLAELAERAALQTRVDRKYVVPVAELGAMLAGLEPGTRALEIDGRRRFAYESVYFDTPDLASYLGAARSRRRRFKVRTRTYVDSGTCWVEVKTRGQRGATVKTRLPHEPDDRDQLDAAGLGFTLDVLGDAEVELADDPRFAPTLISRYDRATLHLPATESRLTIDTDLVWIGVGCADAAALALHGLAIVETKTGSTPSSADRLLWRHGHRPVRISKYGTGMAALHDDLPATRWRRTLDRHVAPYAAPVRAAA